VTPLPETPADLERLAQEAGGAVFWYAATPSWTQQNRAALEEEFRQRPEFARWQQALAAQEAEAVRLREEIEALEERERALSQTWREEQEALHRAVLAAIAREHGPLVPRTVWVTLVDEPETVAQLQAGTTPEQRALLLRLGGRCLVCEGALGPADECPDDPGQGFVACSWCRAHRGKSHCSQCGAPLHEDESGCCAACAAPDSGGG
jgi:hypothetical protein